MKIVNTTRFSIIALFMAGSIGTAMAAPISNIVTGTADVVFAASGEASITIQPVTTLLAGKHTSTTIATGRVSATAGNIAYRWTPSVGTAVSGKNTNYRTLSGKASAANKLTVYSFAPSNSGAGATRSPSDPNWWVATNNSNVINNLSIVTNETEQMVAPDTYVISMDAAVWAE